MPHPTTRDEAKLQFCAFDLMFHDGEDLRGLPMLDRKKRLGSEP
jgi:bifunctional non-homologous end joining protein LigD